MTKKSICRRCIALVCSLMMIILMQPFSASAQFFQVGEATVKTCDYLANDAVYQSEKPLGIWGTSTAKAKISAALYQGKKKIAESSVAAEGNNSVWELTLPGQKGGYDKYSIVLSIDGQKQETYTGILFGEVWLSAGQSNMQLHLEDCEGGLDDLLASKDAYLRAFKCNPRPDGEKGATKPAADISGSWKLGDNPSTLYNFSAVSYYFAKDLRKQMDVPVAIIDASMGSTPIDAWVSKEHVDARPELVNTLKTQGVYETGSHWYSLGAMYYSKIVPLSHLSIAGTVWYGGESNNNHSGAFAELMDVLQENYSKEFGFGDQRMPFVFTQIAPYVYDTVNKRGQTELMDQMTQYYQSHRDSSAMVTIYDLSLQYLDCTMTTPAVIHPTVKKPVGQRLAKAAMGLVYGKETVTAPTLVGYQIQNGVAVLKFDNVGEGLKTVDGSSKGVLGFALAGSNGVWVNATAEISGKDTVKVYSHLLKNPKHVSYAYSDMNTDANLCGSHGIPAAPLRTGGFTSLGVRNYLNCDQELFVYQDYAADAVSVGHAAYQDPWTVHTRSKTSYDKKTYAQGIASVKTTYTKGNAEVVAGMDLTQAVVHTESKGLKNIKNISVQLKNGDNREKSVRLAIGASGNYVYTAPQILAADSDFTTLVFSLKNMTDASGAKSSMAAALCLEMTQLAVCITDSAAGTVWIDDFKLGVDDAWQPDPGSVEYDQNKPAQTTSSTPNASTQSKPDGDNSQEQKGNSFAESLPIIGAGVVVIVAAAVTVLAVLRKKKRVAVPADQAQAPSDDAE